MKRRTYDYQTRVGLYNDERPGAINIVTGKARVAPEVKRKLDDGSEAFRSDRPFFRWSQSSWAFLTRVLTASELKVAMALAVRAKAFTNSLEPLSDSTAKAELMEVLGVCRNLVMPTLNKLFVLGVYARVDMHRTDEVYGQYWVLNPYLQFSGKVIKTGVSEMFRNTYVGMAYFDDTFMLTEEQIQQEIRDRAKRPMKRRSIK